MNKIVNVYKSNITRGGYTLNELIISIAMISILSTIVLKATLSYKIYLNKIDVDYCNNSIVAYINSAKNYCRNKKQSGYIIFDTSRSTLYFMINTTLINKYSLPDKFVLNDVRLGRDINILNIDSNGFNSNGGKIIYFDREHEQHTLVITTITAYVYFEK